MKDLREKLINEYNTPNMFCIYPHNAKVNNEVLGDALIELGKTLKEKDNPEIKLVISDLYGYLYTLNDNGVKYTLVDNISDNEKIYMYQAIISNLQNLLANEILRMKKFGDVDLIVYYKEDMKYGWVKIDQLLHYADGTSKKKYFRYKKGKKY